MIPKWLLRAFKVEEGPAIVRAGEEHGAKHEIKTLKHFQVTLDRGLCKKCSKLLSGLEQVVRPILEPMAVRCEPATLDLDSQRLLAVWAIKDRIPPGACQPPAVSRHSPGRGPPAEHRAETSCLLAPLEQRPANLIEPPPRTMVLLACWDYNKPDPANRASTVHYAPSAAPLPTPDGGPGRRAVHDPGRRLHGLPGVHCGLRAGRAAQGSYLESRPLGQHRRRGPAHLAAPPARRRCRLAPPAFPNDNFDRLVNWDGALRRPAQ